MDKMLEKIELTNSSHSTSESVSSSAECSPAPGAVGAMPSPKRSRVANVLSPEVTATMDRIGISHRSAMHLTSSILRDQAEQDHSTSTSVYSKRLLYLASTKEKSRGSRRGKCGRCDP